MNWQEGQIMAGEISLDPARLENVKHLDNGAIRAACPACRAANSDKSGDHLLIQADGKFGCATHPDDREHRKEIFKLGRHPAFRCPVAQWQRQAFCLRLRLSRRQWQTCLSGLPLFQQGFSTASTRPDQAW